jgi:hypothetical protein
MMMFDVLPPRGGSTRRRSARSAKPICLRGMGTFSTDGGDTSCERPLRLASLGTSPSRGRNVTRRFALAGIVGLALLPAACDRMVTKADILKKAEGARTKADLEKQVGKPSEVDKVGPMEQWTYKTSDGSVVFMILNDRIVFDATGSKPR